MDEYEIVDQYADEDLLKACADTIKGMIEDPRSFGGHQTVVDNYGEPNDRTVTIDIDEETEVVACNVIFDPARRFTITLKRDIVNYLCDQLKSIGVTGINTLVDSPSEYIVIGDLN